MRRPASGVRRPGRRVGFVRAALVLIAAARLAAPSGAQKPSSAGSTADCPPSGQRSICYRSIDAEYVVLRSGDIRVTERYVIRFNGDWNGMTRELIGVATDHAARTAEERAADPDTVWRDAAIEVLGATDANGTALEVDEERDGARTHLRIWVPGARDAERTVVLTYRIEDGVTFFGDHDEFYWNVLGTTSTAPVQRMSVRVALPGAVTGLRADAWTGVTGSQNRPTIHLGDGYVDASSTEPLGAGIGFTVVVGWDVGVIERPGAIERVLGWLGRYGTLVLPALSLGLMWSLWRRRGRDPAMLPIVAQYQPPSDITPGEMGTLLDERADMRDVTATIVDLAVQGHIRIEEVEGTKVFGLEFGEDYRFIRTEPEAGARPLRAHEQKLLSALFGGRSSVELSDLKNEFYKDLPGIRDAMMDSLVGHGVYTSRPDRARAFWVAAAVIVGVVLFFGLGFFPTTAPLALVVVPPLTLMPILLFGWLMPARTVKGTRLIERLRGFREFLSRVDGDRLRRMNIEPSAFEKLLPYAMALGVERKWAEAFDGLAQEPPRWYHSPSGGAFRPTMFATSLGRMSTATASTMSSRPGGSGGGSGFSGGGVGGGGGGGGVGGF